MRNLTANEVSIGFLSKTRLEITARRETLLVHCAELGLLNLKSESFNRQGQILFGMSHKEYPQDKAAGQAVSRLKALLSENLGIKGEIFKPKKERWEPFLEAVLDLTTRADDRAKERAKKSTSSDQSDKYNYKNGNYDEIDYEKIDKELEEEYGDKSEWNGNK